MILSSNKKAKEQRFKQLFEEYYAPSASMPSDLSMTERLGKTLCRMYLPWCGKK
ncbi:hypothetical protein JCM10003_1909 [Bacteroides pyogenes JCM 10003]|nr:hypothetical protein JCM10003_1909 [Bacteroides pyogenes JCM 10003]